MSDGYWDKMRDMLEPVGEPPITAQDDILGAMEEIWQEGWKAQNSPDASTRGAGAVMCISVINLKETIRDRRKRVLQGNRS